MLIGKNAGAIFGIALLMSLSVCGATAAFAQAPVDKEAQKARAKQLAAWKKQYGEGPYPDETEAFLAGKPDVLKPFWSNLWQGGARNAVLNFNRLGLAAMETGDYTLAEKAFDNSLNRIEAVFKKDKAAERALGRSQKEANKDFRGEPYERAMAYYYRGILYLRAGDFGNASASFMNADFQDTVSEQEEYKSDFAVMNFLIGWSKRCQGGSDSSSDFAYAINANKDIVVPPASHNTVMIAELGGGPGKAKSGQYGEKLVFVPPPQPGPDIGAQFLLSGQGKKPPIQAIPFSSVNFQATTRGGKPIDGILAGKASFKGTSGTVGAVGLGVGLAMMQSSDSSTQAAGAIVGAIGGLFSILSATTRPDADIRFWDQLQDTLVVATAATKASDTISVRFMGADGPLDAKPTAFLRGGNNKCSVVWARSRSSLSNDDTPGDDLAVRAKVKRQKDSVIKDRDLRNSLFDM
jgi:hypothetical protein